MDRDSHPQTPISAKRQKILSDAFTQLRKARAKIDPSVLDKIREIVAGSPALMRKLGLGAKMPPVVEKPQAAPDAAMPLSSKSSKPAYHELQEKKSPPKQVETKGGYEETDQAKHMEIMARLMQLNPAVREDIKAAIKKAGR